MESQMTEPAEDQRKRIQDILTKKENIVNWKKCDQKKKSFKRKKKFSKNIENC